MTLRDVYTYSQIEVNKKGAPSLLLADFNYFANKGKTSYINLRYNNYDQNQQSVDDLDSIKVVDFAIDLSLVERYYAGGLPSDYLHILNCVTVFTVQSDYLCYTAGDTIELPTNRLPSGAAKNVLNNYYFTPTYKKSYFYSNDGSLEIRSGDASIFKPTKIYIDYLQTPTVFNLTRDQLNAVADTSQVLDYPEYVSDQILNEIVKLILENASDPRLQTNIPVHQTIGTPGMQTR
jgi:hypothetical protein